jgi:phenylacetate-CoA ligase
MNLKYFLETARFVKNQWLSYDKLLEIQHQKLRRLINHAYFNVPYYRELFDSIGIKPEEIKDSRDLEKIPITRKSTFQNLPLEKKIAKGTNLNKCIRAKTSGSTGRPLEFILSWEDWMRNLSTMPRFLMGAGRRLTDKMLFIFSPSSFLENPIRHRKQWYEYFGIMKKEYFSLFEDVHEQIEAIKRIKPDILVSYPSNLKMLAETIIKEQIQDLKPPKILYSSAEVLTKEVRELCNSAFKVNMLDLYSAWETGPVAGECYKHEGFHVNIDSVVLEVVK